MKNFADILGQKHAIDRLLAAYRGGKLPHAMIFAGPIGVGKATTARALAALWLCEKPANASPCGKCASCRGMEVEQHPDHHVIYKELLRNLEKKKESVARDISIDLIRAELNDKASRKSVMGRGKVFVVEEAELMSAAAQNSMLKTLEEPAGRTLIILLSDSAESLLPTIRSRCQVVTFSFLPEKLVAAELSKSSVSPDSAAKAARLSGGSIGLAKRWLDDGIVDRAGELIAMVDGPAGATIVAELPHWLRKSAEEYAAKQLERDPKSSRDQAVRDGASLYLRIAAEHFRRKLSSLTDPASVENAASRIEALVQSERYLDANVTTSLVYQQAAAALA